MNQMVRKLAAVTLTGVMTFAAVANSYAVSASRSGASVWTSNGDRTVNVKDTASDSAAASGQWVSNKGSYGSVMNKGGFNTVKSQIVVSSPEWVTKVRACRTNGWRPMTCSDYNSHD